MKEVCHCVPHPRLAANNFWHQEWECERMESGHTARLKESRRQGPREELWQHHIFLRMSEIYGCPHPCSLVYPIYPEILARIFHESPAATVDMAVLPGVLSCSFDFAQDRLPLRRTIEATCPAPQAVSWISGFPVSRSRDDNS
jgi:hypothetical protein